MYMKSAALMLAALGVSQNPAAWLKGDAPLGMSLMLVTLDVLQASKT